MAITRYEYYNDYNTRTHIYASDHWTCHTFTPLITHVITRLKLRLGKNGSTPGDVVIGIRATTSDKPSGSDLSTETIDGNSLTTDFNGEIVTIDLTTFVAAVAGTKLAIVVRNPDGVWGDNIFWNLDTTSPTYPRGQYGASGDAGSTWTMGSYDMWFEEWGYPAVETYEARDVQFHQATGVGFLYDEANVDEIGFEWGKVSGGPYPNSITFSGYIEAGTYSDELTGLDAETTYYYRAKIHHTTYGTLYGAEESFTTPRGVPTVRSDPPTSAGTSTMDAVGNITSIGSQLCDKRGFVYGLTSQSAPGDVDPASSGYDSYEEESGIFDTGEFTLEISGLTQNKLYYFRAYAHNSDGYDYGEEMLALTNENVNLLYTTGDYSKNIRFDSSPGDGPNHPSKGTTPHYILVRAIDTVLQTTGSAFGCLSGNFIYERHYYNDNNYTDLFTLANPYRRSGTIVKVKWKAVIGGNNYSYGKYKRVLYTHGTTDEGTEGAAAGTPAALCEIFSTNPVTGSAWTIDELDDLLAGVKLGQGGGWGTPACDMLRIYALWADAEVLTDFGQYLTTTTARLNGYVIEDEAESCDVYFEWGETVAYGNTTATQSKAKGETFSADISGLDPAKSYHFRAVIDTECGETFYGADMLVGADPSMGSIAELLVKGDFI